ncbi:MAG: hypothetical protein KC561_12635 [Myxococcales bacterium]|nr:hypothetical protein [Myxococcales bacterium]
MKRVRRVVVLVGLVCVLTVCDKGTENGSETPEPEQAEPRAGWPEAPSDGTPALVVFEGWEGEGDSREASFMFYNYADRQVTEFSARLQFLNEAGEVIDTWPHMQMERIGVNASADFTGGFNIPAEATSAAAVIRSITYSEGEAWSAEPTEDEAPPINTEPPAIVVEERPLPEGPIALADLLANPEGVLHGWVDQQLTVEALYFSSSSVNGALNTLSLTASQENPFDNDMGCRVAEGVTDPGLVQYTPIQVQGTLTRNSMIGGAAGDAHWVFSLANCTVVPAE